MSSEDDFKSITEKSKQVYQRKKKNDVAPRSNRGIRTTELFPNEKEHCIGLDTKTQTLSDETLFRCTECHYASNKRYRVVNHQRKHTNTRPFKCSHCKYAANFQECLREHVKLHATNRVWKFSCDLCSFKTDTKNIFKSHETIHTGELPLSCALCEKRLATACVSQTLR